MRSGQTGPDHICGLRDDAACAVVDNGAVRIYDVLGPGVTAWRIGDRVMGRGSACHADEVVVAADFVDP